MMTLYLFYKHFTALIATSCWFLSYRKRNSHVTCLRRQFTYKRSHDEDPLHEWMHTISTVHESKLCAYCAIHYLHFEAHNRIKFLRCQACDLCASFAIPLIICVYIVQHPSCYHKPHKTNVFRGILESACLSVSQSVCTSVYKMIVILCPKLLLQFCFKCIKTLHTH